MTARLYGAVTLNPIRRSSARSFDSFDMLDSGKLWYSASVIFRWVNCSANHAAENECSSGYPMSPYILTLPLDDIAYEQEATYEQYSEKYCQ